MKSKHLAKLLTLAAAALAVVALAAPVAQAATPAKGYEAFAGCPSPEEKAGLVFCLHSKVTGGNFKMGNKSVPISNPINISGGFEEITGGANPELKGFAANSKGGLEPVKQLVPGGVIGITGLDWLVNFLNLEGLKLYAVTELAGVPKLTFGQIDLPIKVHLINPVLGSSCYVGSFASPINLHLTVGTTSPPLPNKPISGSPPEFGFNEALEILLLENGKFVDNSFSAPGASGCTLTLFGFIPISINGLVNTASGLPSAAGKNEAIQEIDAEIAVRERVYP